MGSSGWLVCLFFLGGRIFIFLFVGRFSEGGEIGWVMIMVGVVFLRGVEILMRFFGILSLGLGFVFFWLS